MSSELLTKLGQLDASVAELEIVAVDHESKAREARALRATKRQEAAELRTAIQKAIEQQSTQTALAAVQAAQAATEASRNEASKLIESLTKKQAELDALIEANKKPVE